MSLTAIVWMVVNFGFSSIGARELALTMVRDNHSIIFSRQSSARLLLIPVGLLVGALGIAFSPLLRMNPLFGVTATLLGIVNGTNLGWFYQGLRKFKLSLIFEALSYPLNVFFVLLFVKQASDGLNALIALLASACIATVSSYVVAFRIVKPRSLDFRGAIDEIKSAGTFFLQSVNAMLMASGSTYVLSIFSSAAQVGYFGAAEKLTSFALAFLQPAAQVLIPTISHRRKHSPSQVDHLIRNGILFELSFGLAACIGGAILAPQIIGLAFGVPFLPSDHIMRIMVWALPFAAFTHAVGCYVMVPMKNERWIVYAFLIGNCINVTVIALLARKLNAEYVAIARVMGEVVTAMVICYLALKMVSNEVGSPRPKW
jgi:PST family polysaccharide transporter